MLAFASKNVATKQVFELVNQHQCLYLVKYVVYYKIYSSTFGKVFLAVHVLKKIIIVEDMYDKYV